MIRATFAGFSTALSALEANQKRLDVVSQNIANMNTEGYTRQQLQVSSLNYTNPTDFYMNANQVNVGFGAAMDSVMQLRDQFLDVQYRTQNSKTEYNTRIQSSLNSITDYLDESNLDGIRTSFDNIQTALTNMQDPSKVNDPVYEGELRSRMSATATMFNNAASQIKTSETNELQNITGNGSSENGDVDRINVLLKEIAQLNNDIYKNQLVGNQVLELQDERNLKIDQLSKYIPIEVSYHNNWEKDTSTRPYSTTFGTTHVNFPDDLYITLKTTSTSNRLETDDNSLVLVNGHDFSTTPDGELKNYGHVAILNNTKEGGKYLESSLTVDEKARLAGTDIADGTKMSAMSAEQESALGVGNIEINFTAAPDRWSPTTASNGNSNMKWSQKTEKEKLTFTTQSVITSATGSTERIAGGSLQASLDMLADRTSTEYNGTSYRSYDYYMGRLDNLADTWATQMNYLNYMGVTGDYTSRHGGTAKVSLTDDKVKDPAQNDATFLLLVNRKYQGSGKGDYDTSKEMAEDSKDPQNPKITAENISVSRNWISGKTHIGTASDPRDQNSATDTVLNMLEYMVKPKVSANTASARTYADDMNNISTYLANDQFNNDNELKTNSTVLKGIASSKDQLSGVSLDEEAANMMTYLTSYNAAAKLMTTLDEALQMLIGIKQ